MYCGPRIRLQPRHARIRPHRKADLAERGELPANPQRRHPHREVARLRRPVVGHVPRLAGPRAEHRAKLQTLGEGPAPRTDRARSGWSRGAPVRTPRPGRSRSPPRPARAREPARPPTARRVRRCRASRVRSSPSKRVPGSGRPANVPRSPRPQTAHCGPGEPPGPDPSAAPRVSEKALVRSSSPVSTSRLCIAGEGQPCNSARNP